MPCNTCRFFEPREGVKLTGVERYEADTRPEVKTFADKFRWFWNPQQFRRSPPDCIDTMFDGLELEKRKVGYGTCHRFPNAVNHFGDYHCGEYENVRII